MSSPFPGMDPYLEMTAWTDFHTTLAVELRNRIVPLVLPKYVARVEERVYVESQFPEPNIVPDVLVSRTKQAAQCVPAATSGVALLEPMQYVAALPDQRFEPFVEVRDRENNQVITVIEILSPTNKRRGSDGRRQYSEKWNEVLASSEHLVEIDLLRGGDRSPTTRPLLPTTDYCVMLHRRNKRPVVDVFEWPMKNSLPRIPIPLANGDADAVIDMQSVFDTIYDSAGYAYALPYHKALSPDPRPEDAAWIEQCLAARTRKH